MLWLTLIISIFLTSPVWAAVAKDACVNQETVSGCTSCDFSGVTVGAGANYLVVFVGQDQDIAASNITGATWDQGGSNQSMTALADNNGTGNLAAKAFGLDRAENNTSDHPRGSGDLCGTAETEP